jgi:hypothetical protein
MGLRSTSTAAVVLVVLVALSGCNALTGGGTVTPTFASAGDEESAAYTDTGEALNGSTLRADHVGQLESAEAFTTTTDLRIRSGNRTARLNQTTRVDLGAERGRQVSQLSSPQRNGSIRTDAYTLPNVTYQRFVIASGERETVSYRRTSPPYNGTSSVQPVNVTTAKNRELAESVVDSIEWTQTGVEGTDGTAVTRYVATGRENFTEFRNGSDISSVQGVNLSAFGQNVSEIRATMRVDENGVVREFRFRVAGTSQGRDVALTFTVRTTEVGSTTVSEPDWLGEAKNRTG